MLRRTPLRSNPAKTAEWLRRSQAHARSRGSRNKEIRRTSAKRRRQMAERRAVVIPVGPRDPVTPSPDHAFREWVSRLCCAIQLGRETSRVDPAHNRTKRCSGDWIRDANTGELRGNILPLSRLEHDAQHSMGVKSYAAARGLDLETICAAVGRAYRAGWDSVALSHAARRAGGYQFIADINEPTFDSEAA